MGCVLCNITNVENFGTEDKKKPNPFYCPTMREKKQFEGELAYDIAVRHPEMVKKINDFAQAEKERVDNLEVGEVYHYPEAIPEKHSPKDEAKHICLNCNGRGLEPCDNVGGLLPCHICDGTGTLSKHSPKNVGG